MFSATQAMVVEQEQYEKLAMLKGSLIMQVKFYRRHVSL